MYCFVVVLQQSVLRAAVKEMETAHYPESASEYSLSLSVDMIQLEF